MKIEIITWRDASEDEAGWKPSEDIDDEHYVVTSVGFVVKETEANLTLAMDLGPDGYNNGRGRIPKAMIVSRQVLEVKS
jgi:hypothetical protein